MSPPPPIAITQLRQLIQYNLSNDLLSNALFLSGRLHGLDPRSPETVYLLALCHLKLGHFRAAYDYAKDPRLHRPPPTKNAGASSSASEAQLGIAYVFAQACLALGRHGEGINALERCQVLWRGRNFCLDDGRGMERARMANVDAAAVCNLLGRLCRANGEEKKGAEWFAEALRGNPFMWDCLEGLCEGGVPIRTANIFKLTDDLRRDLLTPLLASTSTTTRPDPPPPIQALSNKSTNDPNTPAVAIYDPFNPTRSALDPGLNYGGPNFMSRLNTDKPSEWDTPVAPASANGILYDGDVEMDERDRASVRDVESEAPPAPLRKKNGLGALVGEIDVPKIRGITTRGKSSRLDPPGVSVSEESVGRSDAARSGIPVSHKRTISGQPPPPAPPSSTAGSDTGGSQGIRRSTRIQNHATASTASTTAKATSASSRLAGVFSKDRSERERERERDRDPNKKELPKVKATGTKGTSRLGVGTVGRNVSGNSKRFPPSLSGDDGKESSRPASQASTIRELRETKRSTAAAVADRDVVIDQRALASSSQQDLRDSQREREEEDALKWLLELFAKLGEGYLNLSRYNAPKALELFKALPSSSRETPWVLSKMGRALYESARYKEAADIFARVRKQNLSIAGSSGARERESGALFAGAGASAESAVVEDMHIYSTTLWHLKRDIELAYLAHELLALDRLAPESWVALGNSFSLQREHDKAIRCFRRATQLCGGSGGGKGGGGGGGAYAHTLMGHEHVTQEEFDKATQSYQAALSSNARHFPAWYGLGSVYEKLGKYDVAERHYRIAWNVNPRNSVLAVCLGLVSEKMGRDGSAGANGGGWVLDPRGEGRVKEALAWYERAVRLDPKSAKARFMKARTLMRLAQMPGSNSLGPNMGGFGAISKNERLRQAKQELEELREMAPEESMVHFLLGRCLKVLGDRAGAIREMTIALELDPKASPAIKEALESLEVDDEGSFDEDEDD